ncbi:SDR family oxidoreductase [Deinococcus sp. HMF7620]|uniref:SDR family oxidoreductase n=1 Tax=Deinococcus arboris TaxID=2682977 RepID=A0A7C9LP44_9DEIO|nr:SDR family oxidoreductase [Deinococcus arboris]MVN88557.1 SDR family oxidoreductase [Deinococcus arboris]
MKRRPTPDDLKDAQKLPYPARQSDMQPPPQTDLQNYRPAGKLEGKVALITGGDSGIGRAVALAFALEGARVAIVYNENGGDAQDTRQLVEDRGGACLVVRADVRHKAECQAAVTQTVEAYGGLNVLINNAAYQMAQPDILALTEEQLRRTTETNLYGYIFMIQAALPHLKAGDAIINTGSIVGEVGNELLVDYTATKGGIHALTKSLALQLGKGKKGIRVNAVLPGPVWTPNIPGTMPLEEVQRFGYEVALGRPGQPEELAPAYVFLASDDSSFVMGSLLHVTGGKLSSDS